MIISASRRTDIPAFYSRWFMNRIRAGYCTVPNPFNPHQVATISLAPPDVEVIVFWTRHARPLLPFLDELDRLGYRYYFQYTLLDNPRLLDPRTPSLPVALDTFRQVSDRIGPERVIWRYDPIVFSQLTGPSFHRERFAHIARELRGRTRRVVISVMDPYRKTEKRMSQLSGQGLEVVPQGGRPSGRFDDLMGALVRTAGENGMEITSCAEEIDLRPYGVQPGKCVDDDHIKRVFGLAVSARKDLSQREACGCVVSRDIGMYNSCLFGCCYCYATSSFERARKNWRDHNPQSPSLLSHHDAAPPHAAHQPILPLIT